MALSMQPSDLALLVVLGSACGCPASPEVIAGSAKQLAPQDWQPTTDTVGAAIERAIAIGLVTVDDDAKADITAVRTTPLGRLEMIDLLCKPIPYSTGGFVRACMTAKLRFLHHLPKPERTDHAKDLAQLYRDAIEVLGRVRQLPRPLAGPVLDHLRNQMGCMESELAWLDSMVTARPECRSRV